MPRLFLLWAVLPVLPFPLGLLLLELLHGIGEEAPFALPPGQPSDTAALEFFNSYLLYVTVAFFHVAICIGGTAYVLVRLFELPETARQRGVTVIAILLGLIVATNVGARMFDPPGALTLSYRNICAVILPAVDMKKLLPPACDAEGLSLFATLSLIPYLTGLMVAMCSAGLVGAVVSAPASEGVARDEIIERALQVTALVLVTSTVSMMLFYQLPSAVLTYPDPPTVAAAATLPNAVLPSKEALALAGAYGQAMTLFWAAMFTLTLMAGFGPVVLLNSRMAKEPAAGTGMSLAGFRKQLSAFLAVLAPLIVGSLGPVFDLITKAL